jgi:spermidine synthase
MLPSRFEDLLNESAGKPFTFDHFDMRTLHFDGRFIQSAMRISAPDELLLSYTRAMMAFLLFNPKPQHILMIGLGGGSLAKYCYRHLPASRITVLELDHEVIALRNKFGIAADDERFQVIHADAVDHLAGLGDKVDIILHDGYNVDGLAPALSSEQFYQSCRNVLAPNGVLVSNLWGDGCDLDPVMARIHEVFRTQSCWCNAIGTQNRIVFSANDIDVVMTGSELGKLALQLDERYGLEFSALVDQPEMSFDTAGA